MSGENAESPTAPRPRYRWPWVLAGAVVLAIVLAILWMGREVMRTEQIRKANAPQNQ